MADQPVQPEDEERVQINVTMKRGTIDTLRDMFPVALDDSERVRNAVYQAIERYEATEYMIRDKSE